jgi:hypothetical protein
MDGHIFKNCLDDNSSYDKAIDLGYNNVDNNFGIYDIPQLAYSGE